MRPLEDDRRWGVSIAIPVTFGFYDFAPSDVLEGQLPSHVGTASVLPGAILDVRALPGWIVSPYAHLGAAKDFEGGSTAWVYDAGIRSMISFPTGTWDGRAGQEALWAGAAEAGDALADWYAMAKAGFEFRHELPISVGRSRGDFGLFAVYERYFKPRDSVAVTYAAPSERPDVAGQIEIGATLGTRPALSWNGISMPKLGLSYRFGDGTSSVRFVIGEFF